MSSYKMLSKLLVLLQAILLMSGCAAFSGFPQRATDPKMDLERLEPRIGAEAITACLTNPTVSCRNELITVRMLATDIRFSEFEQSLFQQTRETGFGATLVTLGLTSGAAFAGGTTSQVLAGVAAFIIGAREAFQKEVLAERTVVAIHTAMRANRARVALRLRTGLSQSIDQYPLALGLSDLNDYYNAGTVLGALIGITETVGVEARRAEERLLQLAPLSTASFQPEATAVRQAILAKVDGLSQADAIALVTKPPTPINDDMKLVAETIDPLNQRQHNEKAAKAVLKAWLSQSVEVEDYSKWAAAMP
jgi:hypothetical protein